MLLMPEQGVETWAAPPPRTCVVTLLALGGRPEEADLGWRWERKGN